MFIIVVHLCTLLVLLALSDTPDPKIPTFCKFDYFPLLLVGIPCMCSLQTAVFETPTSPTDMSGDIVCRTGESC